MWKYLFSCLVYDSQDAACVCSVATCVCSVAACVGIVAACVLIMRRAATLIAQRCGSSI